MTDIILYGCVGIGVIIIILALCLYLEFKYPTVAYAYNERRKGCTECRSPAFIRVPPPIELRKKR